MKLFALIFFAAITAQASPFPKNNILPTEMPASFTEGYDFEGILSLSGCSGSLIQLENGKDSDKALVMTNGHCYEGGFANPGQFIANQPSKRTFQVLSSNAQVLGKITATTLLYSTMTGTDISLYQVQETYSEIKATFNVRPLILSSRRPELNMPIEIISGYWKRGYRCGLEKFVETLKEDQWTMNDSLRYSRPGCETIGGTSGSPVILSGTRQVIGINNTGSESGKRCTMNNPCEIDGDGNVTFVKGYSYGQQSYWIYSCLNQDQKFDLSTKGCLLTH